MKSLTTVRKKSPNYPVEFKIKMVELSHRPDISVAQLAREHGINDNLLFKWRQYWREGKLRPPSTTENSVPELLPITLDAEDLVPTTSSRSQPVWIRASASVSSGLRLHRRSCQSFDLRAMACSCARETRRQRLTRLIRHPPATRARALSTFFVGHIQRLLSAARFPWFSCPAGAAAL